MTTSFESGEPVGISEVEFGEMRGAARAADERISRLEASVDARFAKFEGKIDGMDSKLDSLIENAKVRRALATSNAQTLSTIKWLIGTALTIGAAYLGTHHFNFGGL